MRGDKLLISKEKSKSHTRAEGTHLRTNLKRMTSLSKLGFGPHWGRCSCNHWIDETLAGLHEPELSYYHSQSSRKSPSRVQQAGAVGSYLESTGVLLQIQEELAVSAFGGLWESGH